MLCIFSAPVYADWYSHSFEIMGTQAKVEFEWFDKIQAESLVERVVSEMHRIDNLMSPFKVDSELSKINREAVKLIASDQADAAILLFDPVLSEIEEVAGDAGAARRYFNYACHRCGAAARRGRGDPARAK